MAKAFLSNANFLARDGSLDAEDLKGKGHDDAGE
jgi:hypothetical protein